MATVPGAQPNGPTDTAKGLATVHVRKENGGPGLAYVSGELDLATADEVAADLVRAVVTLGPDLTIDLSGVTFCDARGLSVLVKTANRAERAGGRVRLRAVSPALARLLRITGLDRRLHQESHAPAGAERSIRTPASPRRADGSRRSGTALPAAGARGETLHQSV